jgi:hypothetical protein
MYVGNLVRVGGIHDDSFIAVHLRLGVTIQKRVKWEGPPSFVLNE